MYLPCHNVSSRRESHYLFNLTHLAVESALLVVGNYSVHGCEPAQMAALVELLNMMEAFIKVAITNNGDPARLAYAAYFNGVDHTIVESMLQKIAYGEAMSLGEQRRSPVLVCARNAGKTVSVWEHCQKDSKLGAFYAHGREFIILCPIFFTRLNPYPISRDCGTLVDSGTRLAGPNIAITQYSVLVHEIAHFYLQDAGLMNEAYEANNCMSLPANESIINPQNYAFYVASKSLPSSCEIPCNLILTIIQMLKRSADSFRSIDQDEIRIENY